MSSVTKFMLLLISAACFRDADCRLDGQQLRQLLQKIYPLSEQQRHGVSRRNIADLSNIRGTGIFQEPSSRDLDVGFAVGVKDEGNDSDLLINDHPLKSYLPISVSNINQPNPGSNAIEEPSSKELNIGVFVDPKKGVSYYDPGYVPESSLNVKPYPYDRLQERYDPFIYNVGQSNPWIVPSVQPALLNPYQQSPLTNPSSLGVYPTPSPITNYLGSSADRFNKLNKLPYSYETSAKLKPAIVVNSQFTPLEGYSRNTAETVSNLDQLRHVVYPYHGLYQQPFDVGGKISNNPISFNDISKIFPETLYQQSIAAKGLDYATYPETYPPLIYARPYQKTYDLAPYKVANIKHSSPSRNLENVFRVDEQVPKDSYPYAAEPIAIRHELEEPEVILDHRGTPVISAQPYGTRQVGTFRLRNDHGYRVLVSHYGILKRN
jgi:hypothetical protein